MNKLQIVIVMIRRLRTSRQQLVHTSLSRRQPHRLVRHRKLKKTAGQSLVATSLWSSTTAITTSTVITGSKLRRSSVIRDASEIAQTRKYAAMGSKQSGLASNLSSSTTAMMTSIVTTGGKRRRFSATCDTSETSHTRKSVVKIAKLSRVLTCHQVQLH